MSPASAPVAMLAVVAGKRWPRVQEITVDAIRPARMPATRPPNRPPGAARIPATAPATKPTSSSPEILRAATAETTIGSDARSNSKTGVSTSKPGILLHACRQRQHQRERDKGGDTADHDPAQADPPPRGLPTLSRLGTPEGWPVGECPVLGQRRHVGHRSRGARRPGGAGRCDQIHPRLLRGGKRGAPGRARCSTSQRGRRAGRRVRDGLGWGHADSGLVAPSRRLLTLPTHRTAVS